jgi:hypothetical protein
MVTSSREALTGGTGRLGDAPRGYGMPARGRTFAIERRRR